MLKNELFPCKEKEKAISQSRELEVWGFNGGNPGMVCKICNMCKSTIFFSWLTAFINQCVKKLENKTFKDLLPLVMALCARCHIISHGQEGLVK